MANSTIERDQRQMRIQGRLTRLVGPGAAAFFVDACRLMVAYPPFEAQTHLVAHCLREIESAMREVLTTVSSKEAGNDDGAGDAHRANIEAILDALGEPDEGALRQSWLKLRAHNLHKYAHRRSLRPARSADEDYDSIWESAQQVFDEALSRFEQVFAAVTDELDRLLKIVYATEQDAAAVVARSD